jgi:hypothetical protein
VGVTEIFDFWRAMWHEAWAPWDGLWLFQIRHRPLDRVLAASRPPMPAPRLGSVAILTAD